MRRRPLACLMLLLFLILQLIPADRMIRSAAIVEKCKGQVTGTVTYRQHQKENMQLTLADCQIESGGSVQHADQLLVTLTDDTEYPVGSVLSLSGTVYPIEEKRNPGQFDGKLYYGAKKIAGTVYGENVHILTVHPSPVRESLLQLKKRLSDVYESAADEKTAGLLKSMILGDKSSLDAEIKELYQENGIAHVLAISGLHVSLLGLGLYRLLRRGTGYFLLAGIPTIVLLLAYGYLTGTSVSTVRAVVMCVLFILAEILGRTYDMLTGLALSGLLITVLMPLQLRQSAFYLSFGAVLAIALIAPVWKLYGIWQKKVGQSVGISLAILFVTFPALLDAFYQYPVYSILLNLLVIPLMTAIMAAGLFCGMAGMCWLPAGKAGAWICSLIFGIYENAGRWLLKLPGAVLVTGQPERWKVVCYYMILTGNLMVWYREKHRKKYSSRPERFRPDRKALAGSLMALALGMMFLCVRPRNQMFEITMLDVGQGDSIFLKSPGGTTFLVDGGSSSVSSVGTYRILPFLKSKGYRKIDYVLISHMDKDHISGIMELAEDGTGIGTAVLPWVREKDDAYKNMEQILKDAGTKILYMGAGDRLASETMEVTCLWPEKGLPWEDRNELSMVIMAEYGDFQMLFTGDIGPRAEAALVKNGVLEDVEVLKTAHHGSRYSSSEAFLKEIKPEVSLISCSAANRYGHPGAETLERLDDVGSRIFITKDSGAIMILTDGHEVRVSEYLKKNL